MFRVVIPVLEIERATTFYATLLDLPGERISGGRHYFKCGETILACVDREGGTREFRPNVDHIYFTVNDLESAYQRAATVECEWLEDKIATRDWGERSFYARDPFGNPICIVDEQTAFTGGRFIP